MHSKTRKKKCLLFKKKNKQKTIKENTKDRKKYFLSVLNTVTEKVLQKPFHSVCGNNLNSLTWFQPPFRAVTPSGKAAPL